MDKCIHIHTIESIVRLFYSAGATPLNLTLDYNGLKQLMIIAGHPLTHEEINTILTQGSIITLGQFLQHLINSSCQSNLGKLWYDITGSSLCLLPELCPLCGHVFRKVSSARNNCEHCRSQRSTENAGIPTPLLQAKLKEKEKHES